MPLCKCASRGLLPIKPTIHARLQVNIEFEYWVNTIWPSSHRIDSIRVDICRELLTPMRMGRIMANTGLKNREIIKRENRMDQIYLVEESRIEKIIGEFY